MHRSCAAECENGEAVWVLPALKSVDASGIGHAFIHNLVDAPCRYFNREAQRIANTFLDGPASGGEVYPELASKKVVGIKVAKHQVGIGHRRLASSEALADRTRLNSCRVRPSFQEPHRV